MTTETETETRTVENETPYNVIFGLWPTVRCGKDDRGHYVVGVDGETRGEKVPLSGLVEVNPDAWWVLDTELARCAEGRLIAAAPELLAAASGLLASEERSAAYDQARKNLRSAIARAEGGVS